MITVLAFDPGTANMGVAVVKTNGKKFVVCEHTKIAHTIKDLKGPQVMENIAAFKREVRRFIRKYKPTHIVAERFQSRGLKGVTIEAVSMMLGVLTQLGIKNVQFITAAQWKNQWNKIYSLDNFYVQCRPIEPHQVDAVNIGLYAANLFLGIKQPYVVIKPLQFKRLLIKANTYV